MIRLKKDQKQKVREFVEIAGVSNTTAIDFLKAENFNVQSALNRFYNADVVPLDKDSDGEKLFTQYKSSDAEEEVIDVEGVMQLIQDLEIEPTDKALISFAHLCKAAHMGEFTKEEFIRGSDNLGVSTIQGLKDKLAHLRRRFDDDDVFDDMYNFTFLWACVKGKRLLELDSAITMWGLLFSGRQSWTFTEKWCEFLQDQHGRPINHDTWKQLLQFKKLNAADFSNYDENQAWPHLIDDFVEYAGGTIE